MSNIEQIKKPIEDEYKIYKKFFKEQMITNRRLMNLVLNYILKNKGKELRPILVLLCAKLIGEVNQKTYVSASMIELLHTASLVHDDVIDNSQLRRKSFSIKALWKSKVAVLVGDYLLSKGLLISVKYKTFDILEIVSEAVQKMSEGELLQLEKSRRLNITEEEYFEIIENKTASLLIASATAGVKSVTEDEKYLNSINDFALKLGLAFQIKDDLFDYQKTLIIGKPSANDIQEGKITLPLIYAFNNSEKKEIKKIKKIFAKNNKSKEQIEKIRDFVALHNGIEYSENILKNLLNEAKEILLNNFPETLARNSLIVLVDYVSNRKK